MKSKSITQSITFILLGAFLLGAIPTFAQTNSTSNADDSHLDQGMAVTPAEKKEANRLRSFRARYENFRTDIKQQTINSREEIQDARKEVKVIRDSAKSNAEVFRAETKALVEQATTKEKKKSIVEEAKKKAQERKAEIKTLTAEKKEEIKASQTYLFAKRFELIHAKLQKAIDGISDRMEKMEEKGMNVENSKQFVEEAQSDLNNFTVIAENMKILLSEKSESADQKKALVEELRKLAKEAKETLKSAHTNLREAIKLLKEEIKKNNESDISENETVDSE